MNFPGMPSRDLGGGGTGTARISEQEQAIVKGVSFHHPLPDQIINAIIATDDRSNGELCWQDRRFWRYGFPPRRRLRSIHGERTPRNTHPVLRNALIQAMITDELRYPPECIRPRTYQIAIPGAAT